ncbi:MAG: hypothetical protein Q8934_18855 [Bacillota bacterium]|nr:hypothetical protein [Bacillota bacterium]
MNNSNTTNDILTQLAANPPKVIGGYKKSGWAVKTLEKISNDSIEIEPDGNITAKAILLATDQSYYPAFLTLDMKNGAKIIGVYLITDNKDTFGLIPFEIARDFIDKGEIELTPFRYRTLEKIDGDTFQQNWPDFS